MKTTISSNGPPQLPLTATMPDNSASQASTIASATRSAAPRATDSVNLTESALALQQASSTSSPVDTARVEQLRQSLQAGNYKVNPNTIANKLTSLENQINNSTN